MVTFLLLLVLVSHGAAASSISAFLTFRIDSPKILRRIAVMGKKITEYEPELGKYLSDSEKLHITIDLYHVDESNMDRARTAMEMIEREICAVNKKVTFNGTDMFDSQVLFGNLTQKSHDIMRTIQVISKRSFEVNGIKSLNQYTYHPHMTIVQLPSDRTDLGHKLAKFKGARLHGNQKLETIYLCAMNGNNSGFYKILDQRFVGRCQ